MGLASDPLVTCYHGNCGTCMQAHTFYGTGAEVVTFLPLQIVLYFNVYYSPLWAVASVLTLISKVLKMVDHAYSACIACTCMYIV